MPNPFKYGGVVDKANFCNRRQELIDMVRGMENGERLFLLSERRMGKTSLVKLAVDRLRAKGFPCVYVDLWATDSTETFIGALARELARTLGSDRRNPLQAVGQLFKRLRPTFKAGEGGEFSASFSLEPCEDPEPDLRDALEAPQRHAESTGQRVIVIFDEFQRILEFESDLVERTMRSVIQFDADNAYLLLGSRKHLIQGMVLDSSRPLYRAGTHYPLAPITTKDWLPFLRDRFLPERRIGDELLGHLCSLTGGHPFYTQHLAHALWELCPVNAEIHAGLLDEAVALLVEREQPTYSTIWEALTRNQRRALLGIAMEPRTSSPLSSEFLRRYTLKSASSAQAALRALMERDIIDRDGDGYFVSDRFLRLWIEKEVRQ